MESEKLQKIVRITPEQGVKMAKVEQLARIVATRQFVRTSWSTLGNNRPDFMDKAIRLKIDEATLILEQISHDLELKELEIKRELCKL